MRKHILIPVFLLDKIIELLEFLSMSDCGPVACYDRDIVLWALNLKKYNKNPFQTFSKAVESALSDEAHEAARQRFFAEHNSHWDYDNPF